MSHNDVFVAFIHICTFLSLCFVMYYCISPVFNTMWSKTASLNTVPIMLNLSIQMYIKFLFYSVNIRLFLGFLSASETQGISLLEPDEYYLWIKV